MNFLKPNYRPPAPGLDRQYESSPASLAAADDFDGIEIPDDQEPVWFCVRCNAGNTGLACEKCGADTTRIADRKAKVTL